MAKSKDEHSSGNETSVFSRAFKNLPDDPSKRLDALVDLNKQFRHFYASQLQPVIRFLVQKDTPKDDHGRQELIHRVNVALHDANLTAIDSYSGQRGTLVTDQWHIKLRTRSEDGKRVHTRSVTALPPLELKEHIREEPLMKWRKRVSEGKPLAPRGPRLP